MTIFDVKIIIRAPQETLKNNKIIQFMTPLNKYSLGEHKRCLSKTFKNHGNPNF